MSAHGPKSILHNQYSRNRLSTVFLKIAFVTFDLSILDSILDSKDFMKGLHMLRSDLRVCKVLKRWGMVISSLFGPPDTNCECICCHFKVTNDFRCSNTFNTFKSPFVSSPSDDWFNTLSLC